MKFLRKLFQVSREKRRKYTNVVVQRISFEKEISSKESQAGNISQTSFPSFPSLRLELSEYVSLYVYIYIYILVYIEREIDVYNIYIYI